MNLIRRITFVVSAVAAASLVAACSNLPGALSASNGWAIDPAQSSLNFVTTKAGQAGVAGIGEVQSFKRFTGGMDASGQVKLMIDLVSIDTGVEIRDDRMRNMLWNVKATPQATFSAKLAADQMLMIAGAASTDVDVAGQLELAGQIKPVAAKLRVSRLGNDKIMVVTRAPILVNSNDFGLRAGVEAMRDVMGLNFLSASAPVTFALVLNAQK
jgi:polyisoprenoid-binding protein YceI